jgi:predicted O-methyltransferase YrrM
MDLPTIHRPSLRTLVGKSNLVGAEIGVGEGKNSLNILENLGICTLYLIDPYEEYGKGNDRFEEKSHNPKSQAMVGLSRVSQTLSSFEDKTVQLLTTSFEAVSKIADGELDFVYIDGSHRYAEVKEDIEMYWPKVKVGGLVGGHDFNRSVVKDAIRDCFFRRRSVLCPAEKHVRWAVVDNNPLTEDWWVIR